MGPQNRSNELARIHVQVSLLYGIISFDVASSKCVCQCILGEVPAHRIPACLEARQGFGADYFEPALLWLRLGRKDRV